MSLKVRMTGERPAHRGGRRAFRRKKHKRTAAIVAGGVPVPASCAPTGRWVVHSFCAQGEWGRIGVGNISEHCYRSDVAVKLTSAKRAGGAAVKEICGTLAAGWWCRSVQGSPKRKERWTKMLVLSRKSGERILIGDDVTITVVRIGPNSVRVGIEAPRTTNIVREELCDFGEEEQKPESSEALPL